MSGLLMRSHMTAGQDGFRGESSKQGNDVERRWIARSVSRLGSIDPPSARTLARPGLGGMRGVAPDASCRSG
jgi:hypothetical protein